MTNSIETIVIKKEPLSEQVERIEKAGYKPFYIRRKNYTLQGMDNFLENPEHIEAKFDFFEPKPFIDYVKEFKIDASRIVPFKDKDQLQAYVDFHTPDKASWCKHIVNLKLQRDKDLAAWLKQDGNIVTQRDIADFFLDYKELFTGVDGADVVEIASKIKVISDEEINSDVSGGGVDVLYKRKEKMKLEDGRDVPDVFTVSLPVFVGFSRYNFQFRLAWRKEGTKICFKIMLIRPHVILDAAFGEVAQHVADRSGVKAYGYGDAA